ncbi:MAG: type II toxin-antitoxin system VapC family toxin [Pyrinomonadaceae bacterium]
MRLLLDTPTFLWAISQPAKLPARSRSAIEDDSNHAFVSAISFWEITIKVRIHKLSLGSDDDLLVAAARTGIVPIPLTSDEVATYGNLTEASHDDPFDRMLIWQAISQKLVLVSGDAEFRRFVPDGLRLLWKGSSVLKV